MTLLINRGKAAGSAGPVIRNYTITTGSTGLVAASISNQSYMHGQVFINDTVNSLFFGYSIMNFNGIIQTSIYDMVGHTFDIDITDYTSGSDIGLSIVNHEPLTLFVSIIQEL